jgi:outer membrane lipoprotein-sorting protein
MRRYAVLVPAFLLLSLAMHAQTVDELIAKNVNAKGGMAKLRSINSIRVTGNFEAGGMQAGFVELEKRPNKLRRDVSIQGLTLTQAYDGQSGWQIVPFTGKKDPEAMGGDDLKNMEEEADIDGPLMDYKQKGHKVELVGKEKIEGTDAYNIKVTLKNGNVRNIYLDADSFLEIKTTGKVTVRGTEVTFNTSLGDYKKVDGVMFPFSIEQHQEGGQGGEQKITIEKVEFNIPVDDASFKMPAVTATPAPKEKTEPSPAPAGQQPPKPDTATKPPLVN